MPPSGGDAGGRIPPLQVTQPTRRVRDAAPYGGRGWWSQATVAGGNAGGVAGGNAGGGLALHDNRQ
ncbi:MAG: hypothetical protein FWE59_01345, partial [Oscillospiraceae bacterium]|nr:hypothetical protein [Oscillospiraceae bacterium]